MVYGNFSFINYFCGTGVGNGAYVRDRFMINHEVSPICSNDVSVVTGLLAAVLHHESYDCYT